MHDCADWRCPCQNERQHTWRELRRDIDNFIAFKRRLGFVYKGGEASLRRFQRFVEPFLRSRRGPLSLKTITDRFIAEGGKLSCRMFCVDVARVRHLCLYRRRLDPQAYAPDSLTLPQVKFLPYLLTKAEVRKTLIAARRYSGPGPRCSGETAYLLVLICYCTGLRIGEATRLQLDAVDTDACTFCIRDSKRKTRIAPFGHDLSQEIKRYMRKRILLVHPRSGAKELLLGLDGRPLGYWRANQVLTVIWRQLGLKPPSGHGGVRPTDLRHAFARERLAAWYRKGADLNAQLPWLSAYMGHTNLLGTEIYLHTTPELMRTASRLFERRFRQAGSL